MDDREFKALLREIVNDAEGALAAGGATQPVDRAKARAYAARVWVNAETIMAELNREEVDRTPGT